MYFGGRHWPCVIILSLTVFSSGGAHVVRANELNKDQMIRTSLKYSASCCDWEIVAQWNSELSRTLAPVSEKYDNNSHIYILLQDGTVSSLFFFWTPAVASSIHLPLTEKHKQTPCFPHQSLVSTSVFAQ